MQTLSSQPVANPLLPPQKPRAFEDPLTRTEIMSPADRPLVSAVAPATETRRKLPDEIKAIFETNSKNFAAYAKNGKQEKIFSADKVLDAWDRALLLGEYPSARSEQQKLKRIDFVSASSGIVPQKTDARRDNTAFPSRVMDQGIASPVRFAESGIKTISSPVKPASAMSIVPKKPTAVSAVPVKPRQLATNATPLISSKDPIGPTPNMSETLVEKIIEGQMRSVFENAPPLLQKELEKMAMKEILSAGGEPTQGNTIENEVWKKKLREYLIKLHTQAQSVFPDANTANPNEGELVLNYVKRVYPVLLKSQITK